MSSLADLATSLSENPESTWSGSSGRCWFDGGIFTYFPRNGPIRSSLRKPSFVFKAVTLNLTREECGVCAHKSSSDGVAERRLRCSFMADVAVPAPRSAQGLSIRLLALLHQFAPSSNAIALLH